MPNTHIRIAEQVASSAQSSLTFSSIPQTYTDLLLLASVRTTTNNGGRDTWVLTLNGVTGANYGYVYNINYEATNNAAGYGGANYPNSRMGYASCAANDSDSTFFGVSKVYIPSYSQTGFRKIVRFDSGTISHTATQFMLARSAGRHSETAAITSITVYPNADNFATGTTYTLYGIKNS
jgi:hypothetical protein